MEMAASEQMNSELELLLSPRELENLEPLRLLDLRENYMPPELEHHLLRPELENLRNLEFKPLLPPEVVRNDMPSKSWGINLEKFPPLPERRDAEHGSFTLRRLLPTPRKRRKVNDYYKKQKRLLEGYTEVETMIETGCASGNPAEDEMKQRERMAILVTNIADIVLFALKVFASIESKSLSIIASILDPFFDLLWGFILWLTSHAMQNPSPHKYPIGKKRMQPVSEPEKDPQKEKWMIGVMTFVIMVQFMLAFYCRRFENKIVRAYAEHHSSSVKTNLISLAAAVLAIRYYWWIDPTGAIIILLYTMNTWKKTFFENLSALIGRTAPPEFLAKLTYLIWNHHKDIKHIDTVRAYTFGSDQYFVEVDIVLPQYMVLSKAHDIGETLQVKLEQLPEVERAFVHTDYEYTHKPEHMTTV
ncbi:metal tolerance protein 9-like isoform X2 [Quercus robur]|uniref:metal tolerance protein 9-like isoform X2 n=1 Tax=Quercus robur TaxID=38942 RepID=UPI0021620AA2|nr:metal tolerance protein 9-like isoform X2 [Quercus robur]